jgi:hypothetical protein
MVADYPDNFPFSVVLGMQYREEGSVLISEWDEPALLNRYFLALSLPKNYSAPYVLQSKNVLAWSSAETPDIAASHHQDHSVVVYSTNTPNSLADVMNYGSNPTKLQYMLQHFGIHLRPIVSNTLPLPTPKTFSRLSEGLSFETPRVEYHGIQEQFMTVFGVRDFDNNSSGIGGIPFAVTESEAVNSPESAVVLVDWGLAGQHASRPDIIAHDKDSDSHFTTVYRADKNDFKGIQGLYFNLSDAINMSHFSYVEDWGPFTNEVPKISYSFGSSSIPNTGHLLTFERGYNIYGSFLKDGEVNPDQPFLISSEPAIINQLPALVFNPYDADEEKFHVVWSQLDGSLFRIVGQDVPLLAPQVIFFEADPPSVQVGQITQLSWETRHAVSVTIEPDVGSGLPFMGDIPTLPLFETTDFTSGPGGTTVVPITVVANVFGDPVIAEFNMNPLQVAAGGSVTVSWNVLVEAGDPATVSLLRGSGGEVFADSPTLHGNFPFHPESTDSYTLLVEGVSGTASSDPITVEVVPLVAPTLNPVPNPLAPTRAYLSWDNVGADSYDLYFVQGDSISEGAVPYKTGITETYFVIQSSTDNKPLFESDVGVSPIYLQADTSYSWQIVAHTPDEEASSIIQSFSTDNSVVAWWRFDGDLLDSSGNSNNGVVGAGSTLGFPSGNTNGQALACSGDDYVDLTPIVDNLGFNKSDDYTMEARYKAAGLQGNGVISHPFGSMINIMTPVGSSPSAAIILANDGRLVFDITDVRGSPDLGLYLTVISTSPAYLEESFHHVVGAYQGGSAVSVSTLFVDGNPQAMDSGTLYPFVATDFTRAALCALPQVNAATGESYELGRFNGWLDEVLIYSQTLSEDRVVHNHCAIETLLGTDPLPDICP